MSPGNRQGRGMKKPRSRFRLASAKGVYGIFFFTAATSYHNSHVLSEFSASHWPVISIQIARNASNTKNIRYFFFERNTSWVNTDCRRTGNILQEDSWLRRRQVLPEKNAWKFRYRSKRRHRIINATLQGGWNIGGTKAREKGDSFLSQDFPTKHNRPSEWSNTTGRPVTNQKPNGEDIYHLGLRGDGDLGGQTGLEVHQRKLNQICGLRNLSKSQKSQQSYRTPEKFNLQRNEVHGKTGGESAERYTCPQEIKNWFLHISLFWPANE